MNLIKTAILAGALATMSVVSMVPASAQDAKIGFIVKQPEEPWFQDEWIYPRQDWR